MLLSLGSEFISARFFNRIGVGQKLLCPDFFVLSMNGQDCLIFRHRIVQYLPAVSAGRNQFLPILSADCNDGFKIPFSLGNGGSDGYLFRTRPVQGVNIDAGVYVSASAADGRPDGMQAVCLVIIGADCRLRCPNSLAVFVC